MNNFHVNNDFPRVMEVSVMNLYIIVMAPRKVEVGDMSPLLMLIITHHSLQVSKTHIYNSDGIQEGRNNNNNTNNNQLFASLVILH